MPPDPILALLSFVGLFVYAVVGGVVGTLTVRLFDLHHTFGYMKTIAGVSNYTDANVGFTFAAVLWPAAVALAIAAASATLVGFGPIYIAHRVGRYVARAQIGSAK